MKVGRSTLKNKSQLPTEELMQLTLFVLQFLKCTKKLRIVVKNSKHEEGLECQKRIKIWLPSRGWPRSGNTGNHEHFPHYLMRDWQEGYVVLLTHEVVHAMGANGKYKGERLCEINACAALLTYRSWR